MDIQVSLRFVLRILICVIITLIILHIGLQFIHLETSIPLFGAIQDRFNLDSEVSIPTWFSQMQLAFAAIILAAISYITKNENDSNWRYWALLVGVFTYMSIDEGAELHEIAARPMRDILGVAESVGPLSNAWVVIAIPLIVLLLVLLYKFLRYLPKRTLILFVIAGFVFVLGAIVVEMLASGSGGFKYALFVAAEEGLEMLGVWLFICALADYIKYRSYKPKISLTT